ALDASRSSVNALQTAVDLAARFDAELLGFFVEDINLLRLAQLPMAREVSFYSSRTRRVKPVEMEMQLRIQAKRIRNSLAQLAEQHGVNWEFRTSRGDVGAEVLAAGADVDLVVMGKIGRSLPGMQRTGSTMRMLTMQRRGMTLILESRVQFLNAPVVAIYDGTKTSNKAMQTAAYLAQSLESPLIVVLVADSENEIEAYHRKARDQLQGFGVEAGFRRLLRPVMTGLAVAVSNESSGPVILPCQGDWFEGEKLCGLVERIENPVFLIRD
ncbi:MAG: universal stress protein, partial [Desulfohalobiaceae bacterium]|nr:universal stress protein [Desulfohalobiaceae bacterium]